VARLREAGWPLVAQVMVAVATLVVGVPYLLPGCVTLELASSIEAGKVRTLRDLAEAYNQDDGRVGGRCVEVSVHGTSSGRAMAALRDGWDASAPNAPNAPEPQAWAPTSSMWLELLRASEAVPGLPTTRDWQSLTQSVLVVAMPETMATALGWPDQQITWERILELSDSGWAPLRHPEWGEFSFGKDNPELSTSGLAATVATFYAAAEVTRQIAPDDLQPEHLGDPEIRAFVQDVEAGVHNYDNDIIDFLRNLARYDADGNALDYVSAVVLQEQLVYEYNTGAYSSDGSPPSERLVTFYPTESTLLLDHPYVVLPSATAAQREAAEDFFQYLRGPEAQERLAEVGFRHREREHEPWALNADVANAIGGLQEVEQGSLVPPPDGEVLQEMLARWGDLRKRANILLVLDTSSSMHNRLGSSGSGRLETVQAAVQEGLDQLLPEVHDVGLWTFPSADRSVPYNQLVPVAPLGDGRADIESEVDGLTPSGGTPLYRTIAAAYDHLVRLSQGQNGPERINAVVVLTDGGNHDADEYASYDLPALLADIDDRAREGSGADSVKVFTIGFSESIEADDFQVLQQISAATRAQAYDASDPASLERIFLDVVNNF
jgi:Ca-activated chloride channel family protein